MKLLIIAQKIDRTDANLGFFHRWVEMIAAHADVAVIANEVGEHALPRNVAVFSLGKESGYGRLRRFIRYRLLLWRLVPRVDGIFYHMCPEYVVAAGLVPILFRKRTLLWYVHKSVTWKLRVAEKLVSGIFTASPESFRLQSKKIAIVGHGIDTNLFVSREGWRFKDLKLITVGRIASVKNLETLILAVEALKKRGKINVSLDIVGEPILLRDKQYQDSLIDLVQRLKLNNAVTFIGARTYEEIPDAYRNHNIFVHASRTGSLDKAVLEAISSGLQIFTSSGAYDNLSSVIFKFKKGDYEDLADKLEEVFMDNKIVYNETGRDFIIKHYNLERLVQKIVNYYG